MPTHTGPTGAPSHPRVLLVTHHFTPESCAPVRRWEAMIERLTPLGFEFGVLAPPPHQATGRVVDRDPALKPGRVSTGAHGERIVRTSYRRHSIGLLSRTRDQVVAAASSIPLGLRHFRRPDVRPNVVIGTVPGIPSMFAAWVLARLLGAKYVVEMRDAWPDLIAPSGMLGTQSRLGLRRRLRLAGTTAAHRAISRLQSRADLVVTTTATFAAVLRSRGQRAVAVIRNGTHLPANPLIRHDDADRARPGIDRPLRAIYLGTIGRAQSLEAVVRAAAMLADRGDKVEVRIVGRGAHAHKIAHLAQRLQAPVSVEPPVKHTEALELYRWADTAVVALHGWGPFEWTIPSKVYEVMSHGVPVTAALAGEAAELIEQQGAGTVVPPDDHEALADLWSRWCEAGSVPPVSDAASEWVLHNATWDVLAEQYGQTLDALVAS